MRLALVQFTPQFPGREENWQRIRTWADSLDADVVLFPELSSCGYGYNGPAEIRGFTDAPRALAPLEEIARRRRRLLVGGFAEEAEGTLYNSAYAIGPEGTQIYRKIHLWNREKQIFRPGSEPLIVSHAGHRFAVEVCYDLQFPELGTLYSRGGAEALLVPMAWADEEPMGPPGGLRPYSHLALATAFSHGIYVAVANRTGVERGAVFPGQSSLTDPYGRMEHLGPEEGVLLTRLDFALLAGAKRPNEWNDLDADARLSVVAPSAAEETSRPKSPAVVPP